MNVERPNAGFPRPDGEDVRGVAVNNAWRRNELEENVQWLLSCASLVIFLQFMYYLWLSFAGIDILINLASLSDRRSGRHTFRFTPEAQRLYLLGLICEPVATMILYYVYNEFEKQAFKEFEEMFPPDEDGMGDSKRYVPNCSNNVLSYLGRQPVLKRALLLGQLPFVLFILSDVNLLINLLGYLYFLQPTEHKMVLVVVLAFCNTFLCNWGIPRSMFALLLIDCFGNIFSFYPRSLSSWFWIRVPCGLYVLVSWGRRLARRRWTVFEPTRFSAVRLLVGHLTQDVDLILLSQMSFLMRWMTLTGQSERRLNNDGAQMQLVVQPPQFPMEEDEIFMNNVIFGID
ncbi:Hypothetical predicted protein [Cloeon dipterum]|uniref:Uncharacterized protein n=1 Tax=Cloeon dipterum TaxID=197152 RepID=A0A8S1C322_9INSE|nr:Hypothetical predicted protein [Cloeon dipterum]